MNGDQPSMFNNGQEAQTSEPQGQQPAPQVDPYQQMLSTITGDGGAQKYATVSDALNSIQPAQVHISRLEQENAQLRDQAAKAQALEEQLAKLTTQQQTPVDPPQQGVGQEDISTMVEQGIVAYNQQQTTVQNQQAVVKALVDTYGDKAEQVYNQRAQALGMDVKQLNELAGKSPSAALQLIGDVKAHTPQKQEGSVNTSALSQQPADQPYKPMHQWTSNKDLVSAWRQVGEETKARLNK